MCSYDTFVAGHNRLLNLSRVYPFNWDRLQPPANPAMNVFIPIRPMYKYYMQDTEWILVDQMMWVSGTYPDSLVIILSNSKERNH